MEHGWNQIKMNSNKFKFKSKKCIVFVCGICVCTVYKIKPEPAPSEVKSTEPTHLWRLFHCRYQATIPLETEANVQWHAPNIRKGGWAEHQHSCLACLISWEAMFPRRQRSGMKAWLPALSVTWMLPHCQALFCVLWMHCGGFEVNVWVIENYLVLFMCSTAWGKKIIPTV